MNLPLPNRRVGSSILGCVLGLGALVLSAFPAAAQDDRFLKLDEKSRFAVEAMLDSAAMLGLPVAPLRSKAYEGIQKKVDSRKIVEQVRIKFGHLRTAYGVLGPVGDQELDAASAVLNAGGKPTQLAAFRQRQKGRSDLEAFTVWADLISRGVPGEDVSSAITKLWQDGADETVFRRLWNGVQEDISSGLNPGAALQARIRETPVRSTPKPVTPPEG